MTSCTSPIRTSCGWQEVCKVDKVLGLSSYSHLLWLVAISRDASLSACVRERFAILLPMHYPIWMRHRRFVSLQQRPLANVGKIVFIGDGETLEFNLSHDVLHT